MPGKIKDLTGKRFGRLTVIEFAFKKTYPSGQSHAIWKCKCDCGNVILVSGTSLKSGLTKSCGCLRKEITSKKSITHGESDTRLYKIWHGMKQRCLNPNCYNFKNYGKRGITICDEWKNNFISFRNWALANGYSNDLSIDRIDVNENYCPENCKWSIWKEQCDNKRQSRFLTVNGETHSAMKWSKIKGIKYHTLISRLNSGWDAEKAVNTPTIK